MSERIWMALIVDGSTRTRSPLNDLASVHGDLDRFLVHGHDDFRQLVLRQQIRFHHRQIARIRIFE